MNSEQPNTQLIRCDRPIPHVVRLTLHRPTARNAYNAVMISELEQCLSWCEQQADIRTVILTGSGTVFCGGADLQEAFTDGGKGLVNSHGGFNPLQHLPRRKIWIAALNGHAFGGGLELALECDFIIAAEQVKIALPEVKHGLLPLGGAIGQLATRLPVSIAREMLLIGEPMDAQRALALGLFYQLVDAAELTDAALALAQRLNRNAPLAVQACNALLKQAHAQDLRQSSAAELKQLQGSGDYQESLLAFSEKRAPLWRGK
ncbi:enoyl-CoA hydratase/isomerase family protein [Erwinia sorbitola]|uniref:Enoyl-CoA hydratase/isomerase family protein n=1 Tax=Erwinia sorbitola TaxID=2681984 RepID=A0ABW9RB27_9GAMM|nr:enoyl-CoA hydratase/isomerase family protein [Erwinia sorbitola]MTD27348.1 enoyl-CoA hydratase/isomerase family protein [Erwinia sorbitola]